MAAMGMEVDESYEDVAPTLRLLDDTQAWYSAGASLLANHVLEVASSHPGRVWEVCDRLFQALLVGAKDPDTSVLKLEGKSFKTRSDLNLECRAILRRYPEDGVRLEGEDEKLIRSLLEFHPRGVQKVKGCQGLVVGTHPTFVDRRCFFMVKGSKGVLEDFSYVRCVDNIQTAEVQAQRNICAVIRRILDLHPTVASPIARLIEERYPTPKDLRISVEQQRNWLQSLLCLCMQRGSFDEGLFSLIIRKMLESDVLIAKIESDEADINEEKLSRIAQILDGNMMVMFEFLQRGIGDIQPSVHDAPLVKWMFSVFETLVLSTPRSRYVQFLFFYFASLQVSWCENLLVILLTVVYNQDRCHSLQKRVTALSYLASFVARATFINPLFGVKVVIYLTNFCATIQDSAERQASEGHIDHSSAELFIATVQAISYMLCFRIASFDSVPEVREALGRVLRPWGGTDTTQDASFTRLLESSLSPLAYIHPNVGRQFLKSLRPYFPGIADRARECLRRAPKVHQSEDDLEQGASLCYPFDPYRLSRSHIFLLGIYKIWEVTDDDNTQTATEEDSDVGGGFEIEDEIAAKRGRAYSREDAVDDIDADFIEGSTNAIQRGFIPSVGPSPAFHPRRSIDMDGVSPLILPMEAMDDDDGFALPQATVDLNASSALMDRFLNSKSMNSRK